MRIRKFLILILTLCLCVPVFGENICDRKVVLKSVDFPGNHKEDGHWAALLAGMDGRVYVGLNTEGGGHAHFYIYDPKKNEMIHRADMAEFLGEAGEGIRTHGKIHSKFCEDKDGNIYFATGNMGSGPVEVDPMSWRGGHWCKYDPKTDKLEDLGLIAPYAGIYGLAIDKSKNLLFGTSEDGHCYIYDISTGQSIDKGRVTISAHTAARTVVCDDEGNFYGTSPPDRIFKYDSKSGRVVDIGLKLPTDPTAYPKPSTIADKLMRAGVWDEKNKKIYGVEGATSILFEFAPKAGKEGEIKVLDRLMPYQDSEAVRKGHYATLSFTLGRDGKIYYMPIGSMLPKDSEQANKDADFFNWAGQAYLITYDLTTGKKECLGRVYTEDGAKVIGVLNAAPSGGGTTGPDGTIYFCSFVEEKNPDLIVHHFANVPVRLRLLVYKP